jgi:hypothetical protein
MEIIFDNFKKPLYKPPVSNFGSYEKFVRLDRKE